LRDDLARERRDDSDMQKKKMD